MYLLYMFAKYTRYVSAFTTEERIERVRRCTMRWFRIPVKNVVLRPVLTIFTSRDNDRKLSIHFCHMNALPSPDSVSTKERLKWLSATESGCSTYASDESGDSFKPE